MKTAIIENDVLAMLWMSLIIFVFLTILIADIGVACVFGACALFLCICVLVALFSR